MLSIKEGVRLPKELAVPVAVYICDQVLAERDYPCILTSGLEGKHSRGSLHYIGHAFDIRHFHIPEDKRASIVREIQGRVGADFDVVLESNHIHVEYQPKTGVNQ